MALFGLFGKKSDVEVLRKHGERATNRRIQAVDRWEAIQSVLRIGGPEAVAALLPRFSFQVDPSITDEEEKDAVFEGILKIGAVAVTPVVAFMRKAESVSWSIKILDRIVPPAIVVEQLCLLLGEMDTEYERDPQRKTQMLATLEERTDPRIAASVVRFLEDTNETVRFNAAGALLAQAEASEHQEALLRCLCREDSVRVRNRILEGFAAREWPVGARADDVRARLSSGYTLDSRGLVRRPK
jgi:hypothetical protein